MGRVVSNAYIREFAGESLDDRKLLPVGRGKRGKEIVDRESS